MDLNGGKVFDSHYHIISDMHKTIALSVHCGEKETQAKTGGQTAVFIDSVGNHEKDGIYRIRFLGLSAARRSHFVTPGRQRLKGCESA